MDLPILFHNISSSSLYTQFIVRFGRNDEVTVSVTNYDFVFLLKKFLLKFEEISVWHMMRNCEMTVLVLPLFDESLCKLRVFLLVLRNSVMI